MTSNFCGSVGLFQRKVDRIRQRSGRINPPITKVEALRRTRRLMNEIEARQHIFIDGHGVAGRLDDENNALVIDWKSITTGGITS